MCNRHLIYVCRSKIHKNLVYLPKPSISTAAGRVEVEVEVECMIRPKKSLSPFLIQKALPLVRSYSS